MNKTITPFLDNIGRTLIGVFTEETETEIVIENPALLLVQANPQTNQLQLQIVPLFFKEFQLNKESSTLWSYKKDHITKSKDLELSEQLTTQYKQLFGLNDSQSEPKVVKLFDDEN
jgi:hypothetical protein